MRRKVETRNMKKEFVTTSIISKDLSNYIRFVNAVLVDKSISFQTPDSIYKTSSIPIPRVLAMVLL